MWEEKRMLIWCQTYPALSTKYTETVCTGALEIGKPGLMRLYPLALRGLDNTSRHNKWSVIKARVSRATADKRPESWKIDNGSIEFEERFESTSDKRRVEDLYEDRNVYEGLEHLEFEQKRIKTSMGLVKAELVSARLELVTEREQKEWREKFKRITANKDLWEDSIKPIPQAQLRPKVTFRCAGDREEYERTAMGWEIYALARNVREYSPDANIDELSAIFERDLRQKCFGEKHDTRLALGNIKRFPSQFSIISILYPRKDRHDPTAQQGLF